MVTPVNSEQRISANTDKSMPTKQRAERHPDDSQAPQPVKSVAKNQQATPDLEDARQLYQLASSQTERSTNPIDTPEQARNLLDRILQQMASAPKEVLKAHNPGSSTPLAKLLTSAPI